MQLIMIHDQRQEGTTSRALLPGRLRDFRGSDDHLQDASHTPTRSSQYQHRALLCNIITVVAHIHRHTLPSFQLRPPFPWPCPSPQTTLLQSRCPHQQGSGHCLAMFSGSSVSSAIFVLTARLHLVQPVNLQNLCLAEFPRQHQRIKAFSAVSLPQSQNLLDMPLPRSQVKADPMGHFTEKAVLGSHGADRPPN